MGVNNESSFLMQCRTFAPAHRDARRTGRVGRNPNGREIGTIEVELGERARQDRLLGGFSSPLRVQATHVESVLETPQGATPLASSSLDPHLAFAVGPAAWGIQFHPEFDAGVMRAYLNERREQITAEGLDVEGLLSATLETPRGAELLCHFASLLRG